MGILFFDTETTGLFHKKPYDDPAQPHIVQCAAVLTDYDGKEMACVSTMIRPDRWSIHPAAQAVHGISLEDCRKWGMPIAWAMKLFDSLASQATTIVAHNMAFDSQIMACEYHRLGRQSCPFNGSGPQELFCTMKAATDICKIPGRSGYKWPKLVEAHTHFFNKPFENAHDALSDVRACLAVYFALQQQTHTITG